MSPFPARRLRNGLARWRGAIGKLWAGVPLGGERVWPGTRNDLFLAHHSIYRFFSTFAARRRILDAGCGLGYGSRVLADSGARSVHGIDVEPRAIAHARRKYPVPGLTFEIADCEDLAFPEDRFDLVVSSNVLEHLHHPGRFVEGAARSLSSNGEMVLAVPPVLDEGLRADNEENPHHHSNFTIEEWCRLFDLRGWTVTPYAHLHPRMAEMDFGSSLDSRMDPAAFSFPERTPESLAATPTLTAIFHLQR